ncbi:MAG TPA: hypothetical protein VFT38_11660 [Vicinamibacteria bacterium]|nr:hypothetical protein [Vicinamibacteria bacterium]
MRDALGRRAWSLLALAGAILAAAPLRAQKPPAARNDIVYSTEVVTPHVPWAARLPGGPIRGFFIPSISDGRDMVELMQRLQLAPTTVSIDRQWDVNCWGIGDFYGHEERGDRDDFRIVYGYVEEELTSEKPFEVLVIPGLNGWSRMTRPTRDAILRRVREGAGLVLIHPFVGDVAGHPFAGDESKGDERIWELSPLVGVPDDPISERGYPVLKEEAIAQGRWEVAGDHAITRGVDAALLPSAGDAGRFYRYQAAGDVLVRAAGLPVVAVKSYGKGRVVAFAQVGDGLIPDPVDPVKTRTYWNYWEYQYSLFARAVRWAAGRETDPQIASLRASDADGLSLGVTARAPRAIEVEVSAKSEFGLALGTRRARRDVPAGSSTVAFEASDLRPEAGWPGGRQILDVIVRDPGTGATLDWGAASFDVPKPATVASIKTSADVYRQGDLMSVVARAAGRLDGLRLRLTLSDDLGRVLRVEEKGTPGETYFFPRLDGFLGKNVELAAELVDARGRILDHLRHAPVPVVQRERRQKEYRGLLSFESPRHSLAALRQRRLRAQAMDSGFTWGGGVTDSLEVPRGYFGVYWYDRGPTTPEGLERAIKEYERTGDTSALQYLTKKELYRRTRDPRFLVRTPSLDDPAVLDVLREVAFTAARNKAVYDMDYYFVGDEGSLTSYTDPVDFDWGAHALARFRDWLRAEYGSLAALDAKWHKAFARWEDVIPSTTEEARASGNFPPWADHRTYMEVQFANAYRVVREAVVKGDPEGRIALSGTQVTTPWDGADWYRLDRIVDDFLSYSGGNQWDFHRSFAKPGARIGFWTGYGRSGGGVQHEIWTAALSGVLYPNLFWSYSVVNPDLTFSKSGRDMGTAFQALRFEGVGRLLMEAERLGDGIAIHYSMPSVHAAGILGLHASKDVDEDAGPGFPANRDGWAKSLTDVGLSYDFVSYEQVEKGGLDPARLKVFILPLSLALSPAEARAIDGFARGGGMVIADGGAGWLDERCAWQEAGLLDGLFGIAGAPPSKRKLGERTPGLVSVTPAGAAWGLDGPALAGLEALETDVRPAGADVLVRIGEAPAVFAHRVGRGWAVYLNVPFDRYAAARGKDYGGGASRALLRAVLEHAGVRPAVEVRDAAGQPLGRARVARYRFAGREVVAILEENLDVATLYGRDGVTVYDDSNRGRVARQEVVVHLPRAATVTNVRTGADLGRTDAARATLTPGDALVLSLGEGRPALTISGPAAARRGDVVAFALGGAASGRRIVRGHVFDPGGRFVPEYARDVVFDGAGTLRVPTALSDAAGRYRIVATDVLTGVTAEAMLVLE